MLGVVKRHNFLGNVRFQSLRDSDTTRQFRGERDVDNNELTSYAYGSSGSVCSDADADAVVSLRDLAKVRVAAVRVRANMMRWD